MQLGGHQEQSINHPSSQKFKVEQLDPHQLNSH